MGYLLVYGPILAKMWRVYQIFHNPNPGKQVHRSTYYTKEWTLIGVLIRLHVYVRGSELWDFSYLLTMIKEFTVN